MDFLPVFMDVRGKLCLVVGGGEVAHRKVALLLDAGAMVRVAAPQFSAAFAGLRGVECIAERFQPSHLDGVALAIAATNDGAVNLEISEQARAQHSGERR